MQNKDIKTGEIDNNRFSEVDNMWPGISLGLKVKQVLLEQKTRFQDILVFKSESFGNVLVLDGVIQLTEKDESSYQEMLAHIPLYIHPNPERVLIIGGGDLGVLREVVKHKSIKETVLCEIDKGVIEASKQYFPSVSKEYNNKKTKIIIGDGAKFLEQNNQKFDVIIVDSSDPIGPANTLFTKHFYESVKSNLNEYGVIAIQGESLFLHKDITSNLKNMMGKLFNFASYAQVHVPTYPGGNIGILVCSDKNDVKTPNREISDDIKTTLKYYSSEIHKASFVLPNSYNI